MSLPNPANSDETIALDNVLRAIAGWCAVALPVGLASGRVGTEVFLLPIGILFLVHAWIRRDIGWLALGWVQAILALWALMLVRTTFSDASLMHLGEAAATVRYGTFAVAMATWILPDPLWRRRLAISAGLSAGFLAIDALVQFMRGVDLFGRSMRGGRLTATFTFPRVGIMLAWLTPPGALGLYQLGWRKSAGAIFALALAATVLSGERAAFLTITIFSAVMALALLPSRKAILAAFGGLALLIAALLVAFPYMFDRQIKSTADGITNLDSTHYGIIWQRALQMAAARPLTGYGYNAYEIVCPRAEFGPQRTTRRNLMACVNHTHNIYLEFLVGVGAIGLGLFLAFVAALASRLWRARSLFAVDPVFTGLVVLLAIRLVPINTSTEFFRTWSAVPFWLHVSWALALAGSVTAALSATEKTDK